MPKAYDAQRLTITHDPTQRIDFATPKLPEFNFLQQVAEGLINLIEELTGLNFGSPEDFIASLIHVVQNFDPAQAFQDFIVNLASHLPVVGHFLQLVLKLTNGGQPINAGNLFGQIGQQLFGLIPLGSIGNNSPNLLVAPNFPNGASIGDNPVWVWDSTVTSTADGTGSATCTADGTLKVLRSSMVNVVNGQDVAVSTKFKWSGLSSTGTPLKLGVREFFEDGSNADVAIASVPTPGSSGGFTTISGTYSPSVGATQFYLRNIVESSATAGSVWVDDSSAKKNGLLQIPWVEGLAGQLAALVSRIADVISKAVHSITGFFPTAIDAIDDFVDALHNIPFLNILGIGGPANIGSSIQATWDQWISGLVGSVGTGTGLADIFNIGQQVSGNAALGSFSWDILGIRSNKPMKSGFLPTSVSNIGLDALSVGSTTAVTVPITATTALMSYHIIGESMNLGAVSWQGYGTTSITAAYVNVYKMDPATGINTLLHNSANMVGELSGGSAPVPVVYSLPTAITGLIPGDIVGVEQIVRGAGTHNVAGAPTWIQDQAVYPRRWSSVRDSSSTLAPSTITPSYTTTNVPFVEIAVSASPVAIPHSPTTTLFNSSGSVPVPSWASQVQVIEVPSGGGGHVGGTYGVTGEGGNAGTWQTTTWTRGTHFLSSSTPSIAVSIGAGGAGGRLGVSGGAGQNGAATTTTLPATTGFSSQTLSATGGTGAGSAGFGGSNKNGKSPGNATYDAVVYVGGGVQSNFGQDGVIPGGAGAGGNGANVQPGGSGAPGAVWVRFKQ